MKRAMGLERHAGRLWASTLGGPLLVIEEHRLPSWRGLEDGDCDRACAVTDYVGRLEVGDGQGLVLGDEPAMTAAAVRSDGVVFVRWHAADDPLAVELAITALERVGTVDAVDQGMVLQWHGPALIVLDSVEPRREQLDSISPAINASGKARYESRSRRGSIRSASGNWIDA